ncbi:ASKHA domain-containing protein [Dictyoglomus thermophilum]|uniref:2Fe-2S iron-sulfur cluster binding domain protein n=1 Tax=Dictyoglomus thermophilum (strain ATCC 35947 / DSM 3960 / H-6-12) TaxID=309799 RepID=B5YD40_DICT6|nr:ASKHA domain-containing protein [Dictyoglomus thermophilum]ACI19281.1 2Fe-2S iron-sulfur cluster binding domain protein [Dictyoglomus thermophilum H-6-12]
MHEIKVLNENKIIYANEGENLLDILRDNNINIVSLCNGVGWCGKCKVKIWSGKVSALTGEEKKLLSDEEIKNNIRLACQLCIKDDLEIEILEKHDFFNFSKGLEYKFVLNPPIRISKIFHKIDERDIVKSYLECIEKYGVFVKDLNLVKKLTNFVKDNYFDASIIIFDEEIIDIREKDLEKIYGVAVDLGTTTLVATLFDITNGGNLGAKMEVNPQVSYGADVLSRINYIMTHRNGLPVLQDLIDSKVENMILSLCEENKINPEDIYLISVAGNSIMTHIFLGVNPLSIGVFPFTPVFRRGLIVSSRNLFKGIRNAKVYTFPLISGYVGGDIVSGILAVGMDYEDKNILLIDIGTNGEIVLKYKDEFYACATAAGPAFEGGNISQGMIAVNGAIDHVWLEDENIRYSVIGDEQEKGITGSGLIDAVALMLDLKIVDETGRMKKEYFNIGKVKITQKDIREFQLAKSAIRAGIEMVLIKAGISYKDLDKVYISGNFGNYINLENAIKVGLLPPLEMGKFVISGNTSLIGAELLLLDKNFIKKSESIISKIKYIELSSSSEFQDLFIKFMRLGAGYYE